MNIAEGSYHDPRKVSKKEINDSGGKRKKYWEEFYSKNSAKTRQMNNPNEKENQNSFYLAPKDPKKSQYHQSEGGVLKPVNLNRFVSNDRRESWGFPLALKSNLLESKNKTIESNNSPLPDLESHFTLGSKETSPRSIMNVSQIGENGNIFNFSQVNFEIPKKYSNNDPRILKAFYLSTGEKLQKNGTVFTKIHCEGNLIVSVANKANIFNYGFKRMAKEGKGKRWGKGHFVMNGNYQEVFGHWRMKERAKYLILVKEDGIVKLMEFCKRKDKTHEIAKFCYNPFDFKNYRDSVVTSEDLFGVAMRKSGSRGRGKNDRFVKQKKVIVMLRETENKVSIFTRIEGSGLDFGKYEKLGICTFENGLCIQGMFFINKRDNEEESNQFPGLGGLKGSGYAWFFFKNGTYAVELVKPFCKDDQERREKPLNLMKFSPRKNISYGNNSATIKTMVAPISLPFFNPENTEIMSTLMTKDQKWFFVSVYQKAFKVNFLVLFKRKGQELAFFSKLNVQNLQGKYPIDFF